MITHMITREQIIAAVPAEVRATQDAVAVAAAFNVGRVRLRERLVTERGIMATLGPIEGESYLVALEAFVAAPPTGLLAGYHGAIVRMAGWLKRDGLDFGSPSVQSMLDLLAVAGIGTPANAAALRALGTEPDPVDEYEIRCIAWSDDGVWML